MWATCGLQGCALVHCFPEFGLDIYELRLLRLKDVPKVRFVNEHPLEHRGF